MRYTFLKKIILCVVAMTVSTQSLYAVSAAVSANDTSQPKTEIKKQKVEKLIQQHGLSLFDTLKYKPDFKHFDYVNPNAPKGGSLILSHIGGFDNFNPFNGKGEVVAGVALMYDKLLESADDEAGSSYGLIAKTITHPKNHAWVQYTLRPEATFSDGTPITADDVIFSFNILCKDGDPTYKFYYANIKTVKKIDSHTVKFIFSNTGNRELPLITGQIPILPKHYWEKRDFTTASLDIPVVSGQYTIDSFEPNRNVIFKRNPTYWAKDLPIRKGVNNFDTIKYELYRDSSVAFEAFKAGEFDFHLESNAKNWARGYNFDAVKTGKIKKQEFTTLNPKPFQGLVFNLRRPLFQNPALRKALNLTHDFKWLNNNLFYNAYAETDSFFERSEMEATGLPTGKELEILNAFKQMLPAEIFTTDINKKLCNDDRLCSRLARKTLIDAGYKFNNGLLYTPDNQPVKFEILNVSPAVERALLPMTEKMKKIGVDVTIRSIDTAQYIRRINEFDYDMIVSGWGQAPSPGNEQRSYWGSVAADQSISRNYAGIKDKAIDGLIERLIFAKNRPDLVASTKALDRVLRHKQFAIPMWHAPADRIAHWDKFGLPTVTGDNYGIETNIKFWWKK